ncbi:MAG: redox-sensing transcriptional repressor Rex [Anaerolineales bacterium]|jgi:redox-sensing transcriptional repressor
MKSKMIPDIVIGRLPIYLRSLRRMQQSGRQITSSQELGERLGISAAQIRKDLSQFGEFGKQGTGYNIAYLADQLEAILKLDRVWDVVVVGAGGVGQALARYDGFHHRGFQITMIFDNDPVKVGQPIGELVVKDIAEMKEAIQLAGIKVAMITVPAEHAAEVAKQLVEAGIKAILNYAPVNLSVPLDVKVQHIDPAVHLQRMTYYLD